MASSERFQLFNLATMSGVFPGTRTMVFQRLHVQPGNQPGAALRWVRVLWYDKPAACVIEQDAAATAVEDATQTAALRIPEPLDGVFLDRLQAALAAASWQMHACGSCVFWQPAQITTADGLPAGRCIWPVGAALVAPDPASLDVQSVLALDCSHWQARATPQVAPPARPGPSSSVAPMRKRAEQETNERWTWLGRLRRLFAGEAKAPPAASQRWEDKVVERSGVGAGTEPCFACQGRIANLGALAVATPEGDKQTFSIWRCRVCYTYYLNDWIDRWERTDSLETEERYYRLAPAEALEVLAVIDNVVDAEHPARRHERDAQRQWMLAFVGERPALSHQIKQGR